MFKIYVRAVVFNQQKQVLLIQKASNQKIAPGRWLLPGGTVEFGEDVATTLNRELLEEVNLIVTDAKILGTKKMILGETHWVGLYYSVSGDVSTVQNMEPAKHAKLDWFSVNDLPVDLDVEDAAFVREVNTV